jgi:hypothetical protein
LTIIYNVKSPNEENLYGELKTPERYEAFIREGAKESYKPMASRRIGAVSWDG